MHTTVLPRCYALLAVTPPCPPPISRQTSCTASITCPPPAAQAGSRYCSSCTCMRVVQELYLFEIWFRPFSLISDGFLRPVILHIILLCSLVACGRSLAVRLLAVFCKKWQPVRMWPTTFPSFNTAAVCRSKEF